MSFLFTKIVLENHHGFKTLKEFMDHKQYTRNGVLRYEKIFGAGFVSTGGIDTTTQFLAELDLKPGQRVLVSFSCCLHIFNYSPSFFSSKHLRVNLNSFYLSLTYFYFIVYLNLIYIDIT